jgi:hypothetical protein
MDNTKTTVLIDKDIHRKFKIYCAIHGYKISGLMEKLMADKVQEDEK